MKCCNPLVGVALAGLVLVGCASTPIQVDDETVLESVRPVDISEDSSLARGQVLWGGVIIGSENLDGETQLEVLGYPLDRTQRPQTAREPEGRFLVATEGYLETLDYAEGRAVTVLGELSGVAEGQVGGARRSWPRVRATEIHLWRPGDDGARPRFSFGIGTGSGGTRGGVGIGIGL